MIVRTSDETRTDVNAEVNRDVWMARNSGYGRAILVILVIINLNFALDFPLTKAALAIVGPAELLFWRWAFAVLVFVPVAVATGALRAPRRRPSFTTVMLVLIAGTVTQTFATVMMNFGLTRTLATNLSVIFLTIPVFASLLASLFLKEALYATRIVGLALALIGTMLISDIDWFGTDILGGGYLIGNVLVLISCVGFACGVVITKRLLESLSFSQVNAYVYIVALLTSIPFAVLEQPRLFQRTLSHDPALWLVLIKIGSVWAAAALGFTWVLSRLEASQTSVSLYLTPIFGVVLSSILLGETITIRIVVGLSCALLGLVVVVYEKAVMRLVGLRNRSADGA
jgi:drug/metabolite transporter (DMT)-like permease